MKKSFACAFSGIVSCIKRERNLRIHIAAALYVILFGWIAGISRTEWICAALCIGLVIGMELMNTAVERLCDALHPDFSEKIGRVKDIAAGAVLISSITAAAAGCLIFLNRTALGRIAQFAAAYPYWAALIGLSIPVCFILLLRRRK